MAARVCLLLCLLLQSVEDESLRFRSCRLSRNSGWWEVVWATPYSEARFKKTFRVTRKTFDFILRRLRADIEKNTVTQLVTVAYAFVSSHPIFTFSNRALESHTYALSTAYTHIFSLSFKHYAAGRQSLPPEIPPESHFIRLNAGKEQKWRELVLMRIEGNQRHNRLPGLSLRFQVAR